MNWSSALQMGQGSVVGLPLEGFPLRREPHKSSGPEIRMEKTLLLTTRARSIVPESKTPRTSVFRRSGHRESHATVAQPVERRFCKPQVGSSILSGGFSETFAATRWACQVYHPKRIRPRDKVARVKYRISGMGCATCARTLEKALAGAPGVNDVVANYMIDAAVVDFDPSKTSEELIRERIESRTSYRVRVVH